MPEKLKPCPAACGGTPVVDRSRGVCCGLVGCFVRRAGWFTVEDWEAIPRRTDASQGMDGFELVARAIIQIGIGLLAQRGTMTETEPGRINELNGILTAELDRRAAARKESKP